MLECPAMTEDRLLSTTEVAAQLGITRQRVLELINERRLVAIKVGRSYVVRFSDLANLERRRGPGRPKKEAA